MHYGGDVDHVERTIADDLFSPVFGAVLVALFMTIAEEGFTRKQRLVFFGLIVIGGTIYLMDKRRREGN